MSSEPIIDFGRGQGPFYIAKAAIGAKIFFQNKTDIFAYRTGQAEFESGVEAFSGKERGEGEEQEKACVAEANKFIHERSGFLVYLFVTAKIQ